MAVFPLALFLFLSALTQVAVINVFPFFVFSSSFFLSFILLNFASAVELSIHRHHPSDTADRERFSVRLPLLNTDSH